jgi:hypothetical protein
VPEKRLKAAEKVARDSQIVAAKARSIPTSSVAQTFGVSESTVENVLREYRESQPELRTVDPIQIVEEMIFEIRGAIGELALAGSTSKQEAVRVGAVAKKLDALKQLQVLMQAVGVLPNDLGTLKIDMDVRAFGSVVLNVFEEENIPPEAVEKIMNEIRKFTGRPEALPSLPAGS